MSTERNRPALPVSDSDIHDIEFAALNDPSELEDGSESPTDESSNAAPAWFSGRPPRPSESRIAPPPTRRPDPPALREEGDSPFAAPESALASTADTVVTPALRKTVRDQRPAAGARVARAGARAGAARGQPPLIAVAPEAPKIDENLPWTKRVVAWVASLAAMGYGVSVMIHVVGLSALLLVVASVPKAKEIPPTFDVMPFEGAGDGGLLSLGVGDDSGGNDGPDSLPLKISPVDGALFAGSDVASMMKPEFPLNNSAIAAGGAGGVGTGGAGEGEGGGVGNGRGLPFRMPGIGEGKVTRKGSFAAWTVPRDPNPGQNYVIVIQIQLPTDIKKLPKKDLLGSTVVGTDGYRLEIPPPGASRGYLPGNDKEVQMVVLVPGAAQLVRDTIKIKSKALKEEHTIEIEF